MRDNKNFRSVFLGICLEVKLTTKLYGSENSWSLGDCSGDQRYSNNAEHIKVCCLNYGVNNLKCQDAYGDGWHGGFIEVQGTQYCEKFNSGTMRNIQLTIIKPGIYTFSQF